LFFARFACSKWAVQILNHAAGAYKPVHVARFAFDAHVKFVDGVYRRALANGDRHVFVCCKYKWSKIISIFLNIRYSYMIILIFLFFMVLLLLLQREGFSLTSTYSTQTILAFTNYLKGKSSINDDAIKNKIDTYEKANVPESSINAYVSTDKWPYTDKFKKVCVEKGVDVDKLTEPEEIYIQQLSKKYGNVTLSSLRSFDVMCKMDASGNSIGKGMYSIKAKDSEYIPNETLNKKIPGFTFLNEPCNPCDILNNNYDCPFSVPGTDKKPLLPDPVLQYVWNI